MTRTYNPDFSLFSSCPPSAGVNGAEYLQQVTTSARWSEQARCTGMLIYSDNQQVDPWLIAQAVIENTDALAPLIALQPVYMHPYTAAKKVASIAHLHRRRVYLNLVAGGFRNDLAALDDTTPHDRRYDRLVEYMQVIDALLAGDGPVTYTGEFYKVSGLKLAPECPPELRPGVFVSGSSDAGRAAARKLGATAIEHPGPAAETAQAFTGSVGGAGVRVGVVTRPDGALAWATALRRFPEDRRGQLTHQLSERVSDSVWHQRLSKLARAHQRNRAPYWLGPFENYRTMCPYLVGDYAEVGGEIAAYMALGYTTFITDIPESPEELGHIGRAFDFALEARKCQDSFKTG